jgi:hypothetical protein
MKWHDFLKLVRTKDLLIRVSFRVQWVVPWSRAQHMTSLDSSMIDSSMNRHVNSSLLRRWYGFRSTSSHEHALYSSEMKWYNFLKLMRTKDLLIRVSFRVQWVVSWSHAQHMISLALSMIDSSMNKHWHLFKRW